MISLGDKQHHESDKTCVTELLQSCGEVDRQEMGNMRRRMGKSFKLQQQLLGNSEKSTEESSILNQEKLCGKHCNAMH